MDLMETLPLKEIKIAYLGEVTPIENFEVISKYFEKMGIKRPPLDVIKLFDLCSIDVDIFSNIEEIFECEDQYDVVFNCKLSIKSIDQISIFDKINDMTRDNGLILNCVPWCTLVEEGFYSYQPEFFNFIAQRYSYYSHKKILGTESAKFYFDYDYSVDGFAGKQFEIMTGNLFYENFPSKAWLEKTYIATVMQKPGPEEVEEDVQEDD